MTDISIVQVAIGMIVGALVGIAIRASMHKRHIENAELQANKLVAEAKRKQQDILLEAKEKGLKLVDKADQDAKERRDELKQLQQRLEQRENAFDKKLLSLEERTTDLEKEKERLRGVKSRLEELHTEASERLQSVAKLSKEEALEHLLKDVQTDCADVLSSRTRKLEQEVEEEIDRKAKKLLALVIERYAGNIVVETTTTNVTLPNDEMKGRIIGKEGRNIKAIEKLTGTEIIIDDTPEMITISSFSPVRRQVAKRAIESLVKTAASSRRASRKRLPKQKKNCRSR